MTETAVPMNRRKLFRKVHRYAFVIGVLAIGSLVALGIAWVYLKIVESRLP